MYLKPSVYRMDWCCFKLLRLFFVLKNGDRWLDCPSMGSKSFDTFALCLLEHRLCYTNAVSEYV